MANQKHMKVLCLLLIAALGISLVPSAVFAEEPVVNLAKNATVLGVSASSPNNDETAEHAFDGDEHLTKWCTINSPGWVVFDIGAAANISELKVFHAGEGTNETIPNNTKAFELQILDETKCTEQAFSETSDKTTIMTTDGYWKSVCTVKNNTNSITDNDLTGCTARFFRFHVSDAGEDKCIRIYEIELFCESTGKPPRPDYTVTVENGKATVLTWNDNHFNVGEWGQTIKAEQGYEVALKLNEDYAVPAGKALIGFDVTAGTKQLNTAETWVGGSDYYISFTMPDKDVTVKPIFGTAIDTIYISVHVPVAGEHPNDIVTPAKPDSHYAVLKVKWFVYDDQGNAERMDSDAVFEVGKEYEVQFTVTPDDGYSLNIDDGEDGRIFINNKDISEFPEYGCRHGDVRLFFPPVKPGDHTLRYKTASAYGQFPKEYNDNYWEEKHIPDGPYTLKTDKELGLTCIDDEYLFLGWTESQKDHLYQFKDDPPADLITSLTFAAGDTDRKEVRAVWGLDSNKDGVADCMEEKCTFTKDMNAAAVGKTAADPGLETETAIYPKGEEAWFGSMPVIEGYFPIGWTEQPQPVVAKDAAQIPQTIDLIKMDSDKTVYLLWAEDANNNHIPDFEEQQGGEPGDVNADGEVDNVDAAIVLQYDAGILDEADIVNFSLGDVNADGEVDNVDAALILQYDAGLIDGL